MTSDNVLTGILETLSVPTDRVIYIHSSMDWLLRAGVGMREAIEALIDWIERGGGTLVMPAYPFRGSHETYLQGEPTLDVRRTPARVGLLNETLRRNPLARRSADPDLSVVALGRDAGSLAGGLLTGKDPTGPDSPFQRAIDLGGVLVGLGVSYNYMNMIHVLDSRYRAHYPLPIYSDREYPAHSRDAEGRVHHVVKQAMLNELQIHIKPGRVVTELEPGHDVFRAVRRGDTDFFVWELPTWERLCVGHLEARLSEGRFPCWLDAFARQAAAAAEAERGLGGTRP